MAAGTLAVVLLLCVALGGDARLNKNKFEDDLLHAADRSVPANPQRDTAPRRRGMKSQVAKKPFHYEDLLPKPKAKAKVVRHEEEEEERPAGRERDEAAVVERRAGRQGHHRAAKHARRQEEEQEANPDDAEWKPSNHRQKRRARREATRDEVEVDANANDKVVDLEEVEGRANKRRRRDADEGEQNQRQQEQAQQQQQNQDQGQPDDVNQQQDQQQQQQQGEGEQVQDAGAAQELKQRAQQQQNEESREHKCESVAYDGPMDEASPLDRSAITDILAAHNTARAEATPAPMNMPMLQWDTNLARRAQDYADSCPGMIHSSVKARVDEKNNGGYAYVGELMASGPELSAEQGVHVVNLWAGERSFYTYDATKCGSSKEFVCGVCKPHRMCGHYTQVVWSATKFVGCGVKQCDGSYLWVCHYGEGGNLAGEAPYTKSESGVATCYTQYATQ